MEIRETGNQAGGNKGPGKPEKGGVQGSGLGKDPREQIHTKASEIADGARDQTFIGAGSAGVQRIEEELKDLRSPSATAEDQVALTDAKLDEKKAFKKKNFWQKMSKPARVLAATVVVGAGVGTAVVINHANQPDDNPNVKIEQTLPRLTSDNWESMPQAKIRELAKVPPVQAIEPNQYLSTVSPALQEVAKQADYTIVYQGDPNDTTGRTVMTKDRQEPVSLSGYKYRELEIFDPPGFGDSTYCVSGIFKAWVPNPSDPQQQNQVYALLENPLTKDSYLVNVGLGSSDTNQDQRATYFTVDNLNYGPKEILSPKFKQLVPTFDLPDNMNDPNAERKGFPNGDGKEFPAKYISFKNLLGKTNSSLDPIAKPGESVTIILQQAAKDKNGARLGNLFIIKRVGGTQTWEKETGVK